MGNLGELIRMEETTEVDDDSDDELAGIKTDVQEKEGEEDTGDDAGKDKGADATGEGADDSDADADGTDKSATSGDDSDDRYKTLAEENASLKQQIRAQDRKMAVIEAQLGRLTKKTPVKQDDDEDFLGDDEGKKEPEELSKVEELQAVLGNIEQVKGPILQTLVEVMENNPKYADVKSVCTRSRFDDIFEAAAEDISRDTGMSKVEAALSVEVNVWSKPNPYAFMYDIIKEHHPDFAKERAAKAAADEGKKADDKTDKTEKTEKKTPKKAPASIAALGGEGQDKVSGWTAERIDNLDEDELDQVPPGVYEKYLRGELD